MSMIFNFFRKLFAKPAIEIDSLNLNPDDTGILRFNFKNIDIGFPDRPVFGQKYKYDGLFIEFEMDGKKFKKPFSQEFSFDGFQWIAIPNPDPIKIGLMDEECV